MNVEVTNMYLWSESRRATGRETTELLQHKDILLQEMQHRVANSLQIIASILMLEARTMQSEESRLPLQDAYRRIISVATLQRHLQARRSAIFISSLPSQATFTNSLPHEAFRVGVAANVVKLPEMRPLEPLTSATILFFVLSALGSEEVDMYYFVCRTRQFR